MIFEVQHPEHAGDEVFEFDEHDHSGAARAYAEWFYGRNDYEAPSEPVNVRRKGEGDDAWQLYSCGVEMMPTFSAWPYRPDVRIA